MTNSLSPTADSLHAAIMNLPGLPERNDVTFVLGYKMGHRDARHAAAELVGAALLEPVGEGWVMVPKEPTKEMIDAGHMHTMRADEEEPYRARGEAIACYLDMIAAAPKGQP